MQRRSQVKTKIVRVAVDLWKQRFVGISSLDIARVLKIPHSVILRHLFALEREGKGTLRRNVAVSPITISMRGRKDCNLVWKTGRKVNTAIFFPSREVLKRDLEARGQGYGPFSNRLYLGHSQVERCYFDLEVVAKYFNHTERYRIDDDVIGGCIMTKDDYYFSLPEKSRDESTFGRIRYGKRKLADNSSAVAVPLCDLAKLPLAEQKYWEAHEIATPSFASRDRDFEKHRRESFGGEFVNHEDPLSGVLEKAASINKLFKGKDLLQNTQNDYLRYPSTNTRKAYADAHVELYKIIGPDSLNKELIKCILTRKLGKSKEELLHKKSRREKGTTDLFMLIFEPLGTAKQDEVEKAWSVVKQGRIEGAHKVIQASLPEDNYRDRFRHDCEVLLRALEIVEKELSNVMGRQTRASLGKKS
jgi:hypothetical protein